MATYMCEKYGLVCRCGKICDKYWNYCPMCADTTERDDEEE